MLFLAQSIIGINTVVTIPSFMFLLLVGKQLELEYS